MAQKNDQIVSSKGVLAVDVISMIVAFVGPALLAYAVPDATLWMYITAYAVAIGAILALRIVVMIAIVCAIFVILAGAAVAQMIRGAR